MASPQESESNILYCKLEFEGRWCYKRRRAKKEFQENLKEFLTSVNYNKDKNSKKSFYLDEEVVTARELLFEKEFNEKKVDGLEFVIRGNKDFIESVEDCVKESDCKILAQKWVTNAQYNADIIGEYSLNYECEKYIKNILSEEKSTVKGGAGMLASSSYTLKVTVNGSIDDVLIFRERVLSFTGDIETAEENLVFY